MATILKINAFIQRVTGFSIMQTLQLFKSELLILFTELSGLVAGLIACGARSGRTSSLPDGSIITVAPMKS